MSLKLKPGLRVFVYGEYIDLRSGFDKLSTLVREKMGARLVDGDLFVFLGRKRSPCKAPCYDGTGIIMGPASRCTIQRRQYERMRSQTRTLSGRQPASRKEAM